jgi:MFS transporter, DHA3 family, tetracycline resistance protein
MHFWRNTFGAYAIYLFLSGMGSFALSLITTINMIYQIETVKLNPLQLVLVGTTLEITCFVCQVPTGVLADAYSRRFAVVLGYLLMGVGFLLEGVFPTFLAVLLAQVLWGSGVTFVSGAEEAWCADEIGEDRVGAVFIRGAQVGQVVSLLAIPLSIWLAAQFKLNIPVVLGGGLFILLSVFLGLFMPERNFGRNAQSEQSNWQAMKQIVVDGGRAVRGNRMLWLILAITAFAALASEGFDRLQTDHFIKDFTFPALWHLSSLTWFGVISMGGSLLALAASEVLRRSLNTNKQGAVIRVLFGFNVLLIVSIVVFALTKSFYVALGAFWCAYVFRNIDIPLYNTWITRNSKASMRATIISLFGQVDALGQIVGGPGVGVIGTLVSLPVALLTTSAIQTPNVLFFLGALRLDKKRAESGVEDGKEVGIEPVVLEE